jgi:hypothetical protein
MQKRIFHYSCHLALKLFNWKYKTTGGFNSCVQLKTELITAKLPFEISNSENKITEYISGLCVDYIDWINRSKWQAITVVLDV